VRCSSCSAKYKCVGFSGPPNSFIKFIGESNGWEEEKKGECFVGKTGKEVNDGYMPLAGLRRYNVRIGNAYSCLPDTPEHRLDMSKPKHREMVLACAKERLYPELQQNPAQIIVPMGAFACYAVDPEINLELHHGIPLETAWGTVFPMFHPAGGIHEPKKMLIIRTDWHRLGRFLQGRLHNPCDSFANREDYRVVSSPDDVSADLRGRECQPIANDTEIRGQFHKREPYCLSYSVMAGSGRLIYADNRDCLDTYNNYMREWRGPILWHNWAFDERVTRNMGLVYPRRRIVDTMVKAFNLGNIPQGLKALAYRELGMDMLDFDDLVKEPSTDRCLSWLGHAARMKWPKPDPVQVRQDDGSYKTKQPHSMSTKLKTFFTYWNKDNTKCPFEAWDNWEDSHALLNAGMDEEYGHWPGKCITHAAEDKPEEVIRYACRDADALLRLWPRLQHMERRMRKVPQEQWGE
jgi:uracil-DNA glycosylase family 4